MAKTSSLAAAKRRTIPREDSSNNIIVLEEYRLPKTSKQPAFPAVDAATDTEIVYFPLTVDSDLGTEAEHILRHTCGACLSGIKSESIERKHQTRLWIHLTATAYGIALHAIILGLPSAELGSITHIRTPHYIAGI